MSQFRTAARVAPLVLLLLAAAAPAEDFYYVAVFGSQRIPNNPDYSHTFATFVHARSEGPCPTGYVVEDCFTISWLPADGKVRTRALRAECGRNFALRDTLDMALANGARVSMWGPYRIDRELYESAVRQVALLESGRVRYKAVDSGRPTDEVSNCIHAVSSCVGGRRVRVLSPGFGQTASWVVTQAFRAHILDADETHEWVFSYLRLGDYPILRRDFGRNPRSGVYWSRLKLLLGIEP